METSAPLINAIVNNALLYTPTHASNRCCLKSFTSCTSCGRLAAPDFVLKCIEARAVRWSEIWKFYGSLTLLHFQTGGSELCTKRQHRHSSQNYVVYSLLRRLRRARVYNGTRFDTQFIFGVITHGKDILYGRLPQPALERNSLGP